MKVSSACALQWQLHSLIVDHEPYNFCRWKYTRWDQRFEEKLWWRGWQLWRGKQRSGGHQHSYTIHSRSWKQLSKPRGWKAWGNVISVTPNLVAVSLATATSREKKAMLLTDICYISACGTRSEAKEFNLREETVLIQIDLHLSFSSTVSRIFFLSQRECRIQEGLGKKIGNLIKYLASSLLSWQWSIPPCIP